MILRGLPSAPFGPASTDFQVPRPRQQVWNRNWASAAEGLGDPGFGQAPCTVLQRRVHGRAHPTTTARFVITRFLLCSPCTSGTACRKPGITADLAIGSKREGAEVHGRNQAR